MYAERKAKLAAADIDVVNAVIETQPPKQKEKTCSRCFKTGHTAETCTFFTDEMRMRGELPVFGVDTSTPRCAPAEEVKQTTTGERTEARAEEAASAAAAALPRQKASDADAMRLMVAAAAAREALRVAPLPTPTPTSTDSTPKRRLRPNSMPLWLCARVSGFF